DILGARRVDGHVLDLELLIGGGEREIRWSVLVVRCEGRICASRSPARAAHHIPGNYILGPRPGYDRCAQRAERRVATALACFERQRGCAADNLSGVSRFDGKQEAEF